MWTENEKKQNKKRLLLFLFFRFKYVKEILFNIKFCLWVCFIIWKPESYLYISAYDNGSFCFTGSGKKTFFLQKLY